MYSTTASSSWLRVPPDAVADQLGLEAVDDRLCEGGVVRITARVSIDRLRAVHAQTHPAAGFDVAMAAELATLIPSSKVILRWTRNHRAEPLQSRRLPRPRISPKIDRIAWPIGRAPAHAQALAAASAGRQDPLQP
jgi:hypothetical protein